MLLHHNEKDNTYKELKLYVKTKDVPYADEDKEFTPVMPPYENRDYLLFGKLAGVRSADEPMVPLRGLFPQLPEELRERYAEEGWCFHSATWFDMAELPLLAKKYGKTIDLVGKKINPVKQWVREIETFLDCFWIINYHTPGNIIVQIWFDN